jgi:hypothetical protein
MTSSDSVDVRRFWELIEDARRHAGDPADCSAVAALAAALLSSHPREEIVAADHVLRQLMADSYQSPLWAADYLINGGCSDDGFDYFRGWLIAQGREVFEHIVGDLDALAGLPVIRAGAAGQAPVECEDILYIASTAYRTASDEELPARAVPVRCPKLDPAWDFDFDDLAEMRRRLPRLSALCLG